MIDLHATRLNEPLFGWLIGQFNDYLVYLSQFYREYHGNRDQRKQQMEPAENA